LKYRLLALAFSFLLFSALASAQTTCIVNDEEEYAVLAAVLFPNPPEAPKEMRSDIERNAWLASRRVRLDGFHGSHYLLQDETMPSKSARNQDKDFILDFNAKNGQSCKLVASRLQVYLSSENSVAFKSAVEIRKQNSISSANNDIIRGEIVRLTRPGFNKGKTAAMVEADLQAGPEMGVGYRVYLEKSPTTGKWIITGADRTRMY
jgi:hypothetical protein